LIGPRAGLDVLKKRLVNNELARIWKRSWPNLRWYPGICLEELRKPTQKPVMVAGIWL
jgi:hypothetical protein